MIYEFKDPACLCVNHFLPSFCPYPEQEGWPLVHNRSTDVLRQKHGWEVSMCNTGYTVDKMMPAFYRNPTRFCWGQDEILREWEVNHRKSWSCPSQEQHYNVNQNRLTELGYCFNLPPRHREKYVKKKPGQMEMLKSKPSKPWTFTENITVKLHKHTMCAQLFSMDLPAKPGMVMRAFESKHWRKRSRWYLVISRLAWSTKFQSDKGYIMRSQLKTKQNTSKIKRNPCFSSGAPSCGTQKSAS